VNAAFHREVLDTNSTVTVDDLAKNQALPFSRMADVETLVKGFFADIEKFQGEDQTVEVQLAELQSSLLKSESLTCQADSQPT
jgi:hypothetical protein